MPQRPPSPRELAGVGTAIAGLIAGGMLLGWFIDSRAGTLPVFALVGVGVGIASACYYGYVRFRKFMKD